VKDEASGPDVPHFLAKRRPANAKPDPIKVREPEPLFRPEPEDLPPQPDGSEVAEPSPYETKGQAVFTGGDWQEVKLGDDALVFDPAKKPEPARKRWSRNRPSSLPPKRKSGR
jgi:hypothetical protein